MFAWQLYVGGMPLSLNYARGTWSSHWPVNIVSDYWCARTKSRQVWKLFSGASERSMGHSRNYDMRKLWSEDWVCGDRINREVYYNDLRRKTQNTINKNAVTVQIFLEKTMWSDIWNISYVELRIRNQVSYDHRSYERNLSNCVWKPEKVRTSKGFEPVTSRGHGFKPCWSPDFFRLLYPIA